ncbi:MAG TPA: hypothetical protein VI408_10245 [Gaiellaceae bacterium]
MRNVTHFMHVFRRPKTADADQPGIPVVLHCIWCKRVNADGGWAPDNGIVRIAAELDAAGLCPDCRRRLRFQ